MNFRPLYLFLVSSIFLFSCSDKKDENIANEDLQEMDSIEYAEEPQSEASTLSDLETDATFKNWLKFYQSSDTSLSAGNFNLEQINKLELQPGNIAGNFDPEFNKVYEPFLIYNPSKTFYLDIDSYNWDLDDEGVAQFEADQEVNLVNLSDKTVSRVAFFGPSHWVDDALWVSDSIFILLQNNSENQPEVSTYNLKENSVFLFQHSTQLQTGDKTYTHSRLEKKGVKTLR